MSNYHVLEMSKKDRLRVVFHFSVSDQINFAGVNIRSALMEHLGSPIESACPFIQAGELAQIQNGEIYEHIEVVEFDANLTKTQKRDIIDARWTQLSSNIPAKIEERLDFWGYNRNVL